MLSFIAPLSFPRGPRGRPPHTVAGGTPPLSPRGIRAGCLAAALTMAGIGPAVADFIGHGGMVRALAVSPDGSRVLTGSFDYTARLWDFVDQTEAGVLDAHDGPVNAVAFLPDGKRALTAGNDRTVILWDLETVKPVRRLTDHKGPIMALAVTADGTVAASGAWDRSVRLWNLSTGAALGTIEQPAHVNTLAFHPGGKMLVTGSHDGVVRLWDVASGQMLGKLAGHTLAVTQLAVSADGRRLLSAGIDKTLRLWDLPGRTAIGVMSGHENQIYGVAFAPDGKTALSAGRKGFLVHWNLDTGKPIRSIPAHDEIAWAVAFTPDGRFALTASSDEVVRVWHLATGDRIGIPDEDTTEPKPWLTSSHAGAKMFRRCARCHSLSVDGRKRSGPSFAGLFGRRVGTLPGYNYSRTLRDADFEWNEKTLFTLFHKGPEVFLPGTKMPAQRVPDDEQLGHLIDYLREITAPASEGDKPAQ